MKISGKLFLLLLSIIISLVLLSSLVLLKVAQGRLDEEKLSSTRMSVRQMLLSYEYVTADIERYVFDRCRSEEISSYLNGTLVGGTAAQSVKLKLHNIVYNNPYLLGCIAFSPDGKMFSSYPDGEDNRFLSLYSEGFFRTNKDVAWVRDIEGNLYLIRSIYQIYPYRVVGHTVFLIDPDHLRAAIGMDSFTGGCNCVIDGYGNIALMTENSADHEALFRDLVERIREGETLPVRMQYRGEEYRIIAIGHSNGQWNALYAVTAREFLSMFFKLRNGVLFGAALLIAFAAMASWGIAYAFTGNLRKLKTSIKNLDGEMPSQRIPDMGSDEVGELAEEFNRLLERLDQVYHQMLQENAKQQKTEYELLEFKYRSLQAQMSPHFLCNILSSISVLSMAGKNQEVEQLAIDASTYLRSNLNSNDKKFNTIAEELRMVREFVRLAERISVIPVELSVHCPEELYQTVIPNMLLQPFVENSLKHGIAPQMQSAFRIDICVSTTDDNMLWLKITDNGIGYREEVIRELTLIQENPDYHPRHVGFGTAGVIRRLAIQYGSRFIFRVSNDFSNGAVTEIIFPLYTPGQEEHQP